MAVVSRDEVPEFGPAVPTSAVFEKGDEFRTLLFSLLLNAERACYSAPILFNKLSRTRVAMLEDLCILFHVQ
jgi:RAP1 GTPase activating protein 1